MEKKLKNELYNIVKKGLKGSIEKQDKVFNSSSKNRRLFKKAKSLASF